MTHASAKEHRLERDGAALYCLERGSGEPSIVFIHGLAGSHSHFSHQVDHFGAAHRVVAVDLRGHGDSTGPVEPPAIRTFAADVAWLADELRLERLVAVGQSMGGHVAAQLAHDFPDRVAALVFLDSSLIFPPETEPEVRALVEAVHGPGYRPAIETFASRLFAPTDDPDNRERILDGFRMLPQSVLAPTAAGVADWDATDVLPHCRVPALYVAARERPELARVRELLPSMEYGHVVGSGHFLQMEVPEQVNPMIERFLSIKDISGRPQQAAVAAAEPTEPIDIAREAFGRILDREDEQAMRFADPEIEWDLSGYPLPDWPEKGSGRERLQAHMRDYMDSWTHYRPQIRELHSIGDDLLIVLHEAVRLPGSQTDVERDQFQLWTFREGKAIRFRAFRTRQEAFANAGRP